MLPVNNNTNPVLPNPPPVVPQAPLPTPKKSFPKKIIIIIGIVLSVILIVLLAITLLSKKKISSGQITWWGLWEDASVVQPLIDEYQNTHPGIKINYIKQSHQDYRERLTSAMAKGEAPDIFSFHNSWVPMFKNNLDALPASILNPSDFAKNYYKTITSDLVNGNSIVGIPLGYDALTLFINDDIFTKSGKTPPANWDDLRILAKELTTKNEKDEITQSGIALGQTENVDHWQEIIALLMLQNGVDLSRPTGKNTEGALVFFTNFANMDKVWDSSLPASTQAFAGGKLAMYFAPSWRAFEIKAANPNLKFHTVPVPQLPKDTPDQPDITYATYWAQGVWSKSASKMIAWQFLNFLSSQESLQKMYQNASTIRGFGEAYPRIDMASLLSTHPILGSITTQSAGAVGWFLNSRTFDGPTGINTQVSNYFRDAINSINRKEKSPTDALKTCAEGVTQILTQYGLVR